ncbi:type II toxin-antitoxin system VapC family toxin [Mycoavidus sp. HKI]|uniref:type II toxin-antitoxin system VapC family toxin n=1 Tax=Mycoavidus sp. HKI TaxID=2840467 RepID=UPI001CC0E2D3|nr:type II toxin-antitoxin system VapC family toxin [Mycoavidus sp. HKI]UAW64637.1 type II toxin-antitoxin system VapC family toxin [Mycoavidus sp. HKI]
MVVALQISLLSVLPNTDAADYYADIRHQLVTTGEPIGEMDMMIAAHSLSAGALLVTNNIRHFERIETPLLLANWTSQ